MMARAGIAQVRRILGEPAYELPGVLIYHGDCLDLLGRLPEQLFSLTVTSPPYNIGKEYETAVPVPDYLDWCESWLDQVHRVASRDGAFWLNLGYLSLPGRARAIPIAYLLWERIRFFLIQEVVWNYGAGVAAKRFFSPRNEKFLWFVRDPDAYYFDLDAVRDPDIKYPNQFKNGKRKVNLAGKNPTDVWNFPKVTSGKNRSSKERTSHPAQFPIAVIDRIIKACCPPGGLILDPFLGSGTAAEAALRLGRPVVGIEIDEGYVRVAAERVEAVHGERRQLALTTV